MNKKISVIIPIYNAEKYLRQCLDSVINQSYQNLQIICIDDSSIDSSLSILNEYKEKDNRIEIIHKNNEGVSFARNVGLDIANGEYILFVDSDDWIATDTCIDAVSAMEQNDADIVMWSYIREQNNESRKKYIYDSRQIFEKNDILKKLHRRMIGLYKEELRQPENADALCTVWGKLYRRNIIEEQKIRFQDIRKFGTYEDGLFNLDVFYYANKAVFLNEYYYHYRRDDNNSLTNRYNPNLYKQWNQLFRIMAKYITDNQLGLDYKMALYNRVSLSLITLGINIMSGESPTSKKIHQLNYIIKQDKYRQAIKKLELKYLPLHWKVFFICAKTKNAIGIYCLLLVIQKLRGR